MTNARQIKVHIDQIPLLPVDEGSCVCFVRNSFVAIVAAVVIAVVVIVTMAMIDGVKDITIVLYFLYLESHFVVVGLIGWQGGRGGREQQSLFVVYLWKSCNVYYVGSVVVPRGRVIKQIHK